jgi:hypothetical protein
VAFVKALEKAASRRIVMVVGSPPSPARNPETFRFVFGEAAEIVPGHVELMNVLWEMGIEPDVRMLPDPATPRTPLAPSREAAIKVALAQLLVNQWAHWPMGAELEEHARKTVDSRFEELFTRLDGGFQSRWTEPRRDVLITWESRH